MNMECFYRERCCSVVTDFQIKRSFKHRMAKIRHQDCFCARHVLKGNPIKSSKQEKVVLERAARRNILVMKQNTGGSLKRRSRSKLL